MRITDNTKCFECRACVQVCAKNAILLCPDYEGFSYPTIDENKCIDCGLCARVCPALNAESVKNPSGKVYAAQNKDKKILAKSSSGGIFSIIAKNIIEKGGIVYGAAWDKDFNLHHTGVDNLNDLEKLRGSKYVHSDIENIYIDVRNQLKSGRYVYFTGTPCQVAGLKLYIGEDYPILLTSDLICHGTPSQKIFKMFLNQMEKERKGTVVEYKFRDKKIFGWSCSSSSSSVIDPEGKRHYVYYDQNMQSYFNTFLNGHILRNECYECPFACIKRVGDITLADYWGVRKLHPGFPDIKNGVSMVIANTVKGERVLSDLTKYMVIVPSTMSNVLDTSNISLHNPTPKPKDRDGSYERAFSDFIAFRDQHLDKDKPESYYRKRYYKNIIKSILLKIPILNEIVKYRDVKR